MSVEMACCMPGLACSSAQSSPTPSTARGVARVKKRLIRSNSPTAAPDHVVLRTGQRKLSGAALSRRPMAR